MNVRALVLGSLLGVALFAGAALAGGHVDIKPSGTFPASLTAGKSVEVAFAIKYPNGKPVKNAKPLVWAGRGEQQISFMARPGKAAGSYVATVVVPEAGNWAFMIDAGICGNTCTLSKNTAVLAAATK